MHARVKQIPLYHPSLWALIGSVTETILASYNGRLRSHIRKFEGMFLYRVYTICWVEI